MTYDSEHLLANDPFLQASDLIAEAMAPIGGFPLHKTDPELRAQGERMELRLYRLRKILVNLSNAYRLDVAAGRERNWITPEDRRAPQAAA